jgi:hypothetical protein
MQGMAGRADSSHGRDKYPNRNRSSYGRSDAGSAVGSRKGSRLGGERQPSQTSKLMDPQQREAALKKQ